MSQQVDAFVQHIDTRRMGRSGEFGSIPAFVDVALQLRIRKSVATGGVAATLPGGSGCNALHWRYNCTRSLL